MRFSRRAETIGTLVVFAAAIVIWAVTRTYPNYDSYFHLIWGRQLVHGHAPSFGDYAAPTQHPLFVVLSAVLGLILGESADRALVLVCLLSQAALIVGAYRLGAAVFGRWSGLLGALFVAASASFWLYAARGYVDSPFLALVIWAAVLESEERRGALPLLMLAGLMRPEAWVLAFFAWLWWLPRSEHRVWLTLALAAAPIVWALTDLAVTGDPLHSLHATSDLADDLGRVRGLGHVPGSFASFISSTIRPPVAALAVVGVVLAVLVRGWRAIRVPLALFAAGVVTFIGTGALGLSILPRYLTVPSVALCVFAGYALVGFTSLEDAVWRRRWARGSAAATVVGVIGLAILAPSLTNVRAEVTFVQQTHDSLIAMLDDPQVRAGMGCGPITFPTYRLVPDSRWHLDSDRVGARSAKLRPSGVAMFVLTEKGLRRYGFAAGTNPLVNLPGPAYVPLVRHGLLSSYRHCS